MKFYFSLFFCLFFTQNNSFSQNDSTENVVLLSFDAYCVKNNITNSDTLKIGDTVLSDSVLIKKGGYLCLINEKGNLVEYKANEENEKYKIEYLEMDNLPLNTKRSRIEIANFWINSNTKQKREPYLFSNFSNICRMPSEIGILAESKTETLFDTTLIFVNYDYYKSTYEYKHRYDDEDTIFIPKNVRVEVTGIRNNLIYTSSLDSNFFVFTWDLVNKDATDKVNNIAIYRFFAQDNEGKELKSTTLVLKKKEQQLNSYQEYLKTDNTINFENFLKAILTSVTDEETIYFPTFHQKFIKKLPQNAHQKVPSTLRDFIDYFGVRIR